MRRLLTDLRIMLLANLWIVPVVAGLVFALFYFVAPPPPMQARMATGSTEGGYHAFAEQLREELAKEGFTLTLVPSRGSLDNLARLEADEVELALVQSGQELTLDEAARERLHALGALYQEPLWLFVRDGTSIERLPELLERRVAIGGAGGGTQAVVRALLDANRIDHQQLPDAWQEIGGSRAANALIAGELDAAFFIGPAQSQPIQRLAADPQLRLVGLRQAAAYHARLPYLNVLEVGEGMLDMASNTPQEPILTLAPVATLVVGEQFHPSLTALILDAASKVLRNGSLLDPAGTFPARPTAQLETLDEASYFYDKGLPILQRYLPFRIASLADRYIILAIPLLVLLIPLFKAIGPIYQWRIRARIYRWYKYLREIDRQLHQGTLPAHLDEEIARLEQMEDELAEVQVPLSYSNELYQLHVHVRYVIERLQALQQRQAPDPRTLG